MLSDFNDTHCPNHVVCFRKVYRKGVLRRLRLLTFCWNPTSPRLEVFESGAILMFLADKYGGLDTPEKRALAAKIHHLGPKKEQDHLLLWERLDLQARLFWRKQTACFGACAGAEVNKWIVWANATLDPICFKDKLLPRCEYASL